MLNLVTFFIMSWNGKYIFRLNSAIIYIKLVEKPVKRRSKKTNCFCSRTTNFIFGKCLSAFYVCLLFFLWTWLALFGHSNNNETAKHTCVNNTQPHTLRLWKENDDVLKNERARKRVMKESKEKLHRRQAGRQAVRCTNYYI